MSAVTKKYWDGFDQGYEAFGTWMDFTDNPFEGDSEEWQGWRDGFTQAEADRCDDDCY